MIAVETPIDAVTDALARLTEGARNRRSALHTPAVGTLRDGQPDMRIMVLRAVEGRTLRFHTDARSPKVNDVASLPRVAVLGYDADARLQLRLSGAGRVELDTPAVDAAWTEATLFARRAYMVDTAPGTRLDAAGSGLPPAVEGRKPTDAEVAPARQDFALLFVTIDCIDWLHLAERGHRRVRADWDGAGWCASWVVP